MVPQACNRVINCSPTGLLVFPVRPFPCVPGSFSLDEAPRRGCRGMGEGVCDPLPVVVGWRRRAQPRLLLTTGHLDHAGHVMPRPSKYRIAYLDAHSLARSVTANNDDE